MYINFAVIEGPDQGRAFTAVERCAITVGRARDRHFRLNGRFVSRSHFRVELGSSQCLLQHESRNNVTRVNGIEVPAGAPRVLRDGDQIAAGKNVIDVSFRSDDPDTNTAKG